MAKLLLDCQLYGLHYHGEHRLFLLRQDGGLRRVVKIFGKDAQIFTGKVQTMKEEALACSKTQETTEFGNKALKSIYTKICISFTN